MRTEAMVVDDRDESRKLEPKKKNKADRGSIGCKKVKGV